VDPPCGWRSSPPARLIGSVQARALVPLLTAAAVAGLLAAGAPVRAQAPAPGSPPAADPEVEAYRAWYEVRNEARTAMPLAKAYLARFPDGRYADYLGRWVKSARAQLFNDAMKAKDLDEMIALAREALAADAESLDYLYLVAYHGHEALLATPPDYARAAATAEFAQRAIGLIEAGRVPGVVERSEWHRDRTLAWLHQMLALLDDRSGRTGDALTRYEKAAALDPADAYNFLACGSLHQKAYATAVERLNAFPEADRREVDRRPEVQAALEEVNREADAIIRCWSRFMALTGDAGDYGETRGRVSTALAELYAYRHPDTPGGIEQLIRQQARDRTP